MSERARKEHMLQVREAKQRLVEAKAALSDCIAAAYVVGARVKYSTYAYSIVAEVVRCSSGRVKIQNRATGKTRWVEGSSEDLELI